MSVMQLVAVLLGAVLLGYSCNGSPIQNPSGSAALRNFQPSNSNIIGFNRRAIGMPHSANNFNPLGSSQVSAQPVFRPMFSNRNFFSRVVYPTSFGRPLPPSDLNAPLVAQPSSHSFSKGPSAISFGNDQPNTFPPRITDSDRRAPVTFSSGPVLFPSNSPVISNNPVASIDTSEASPTSSVPDVTDTVTATAAVLPSSTNSIVFFPGATDTSPFVDIAGTTDIDIFNDTMFDMECSLKYRRVMYNGECQSLLQQGPCSSDQWLVLKEDGTVHCTERQCSWEQLPYGGNCVDPKDVDVCRTGHMLYVDLSGKVECDCLPGFIYVPRTRDCVAEHDRGSCPHGSFLERDVEGRISCVPNPCLRQGLVKVDGICYKKNYRGRCDTGNSHVMILDDRTADCSTIVPHSIFEVPTLSSCPSGSRRDFFHNCRAVFRVPSQTTFHSLKGDCPPEFERDPKGTCRKVVSLFG